MACYRAVAVVSETAQEDAEADTAVDHHTNIAGRVVEVESTNYQPLATERSLLRVFEVNSFALISLLDSSSSSRTRNSSAPTAD